MGRINSELIEHAYKGARRYIILTKSGPFEVKSHIKLPRAVLDKVSRIIFEVEDKISKGH